MFRVAECLLHRKPIVLVQLYLSLGLLTHKNIVADQIRLAQIEAGGVQTFEDQLRVVVLPVQRYVNDDQFAEARIDIVESVRF